MRWFAFILLAMVLLLPATGAHALRPNLRTDLKQLEDMGRFEEALFFRRSTMDMVLAVHVAWAGAAYDPGMDGFVFETRIDRRYWNIVNGQKRPITELLKKAHLTPAQLDRLDQRVRVYVEDQLSPDYDEMGNFYFRRRAMCLERMGLFYDASYRRRLFGQYCQRVCEPYYRTMSLELARKGDKDGAGAYAKAAEHYAKQAMHEFRRSNGDRIIAQGQSQRPMNGAKVVELLKAALSSSEADARLAAAEGLVEMDQGGAIKGLRDDGDAEIRSLARADDEALPAGLARGVVARYFTDPSQAKPVAQKVLPAASIGLRGNERFAEKLRPYWVADDILPANASGQFQVSFSGKLRIPADGSYRFYIKTDANNRATMSITQPGSSAVRIIQPANDRQLLYTIQTNAAGQTLTRVDFCEPIALKAGLVDFEIVYRGPQARGPQGTAGLRLSWSSEGQVMQVVPEGAYFHEE